MLKRFFSIIAVGTMCITTAAYGATQCVWLDPQQSCTVTKVQGIRWYAQCSHTINGETKTTYITGFAGCSATDRDIKTSLTLQASDTFEANRYCRCQMTKPYTGSWVYASDESTATNCYANCATSCKKIVESTVKEYEWRDALFYYNGGVE